MTASFYSKVGIFHTSEALNLTITFALRIAKAKTPAHRMCGRPRPPTWSWGGTPSSKVKSDGTCDASVIVIEIISHLCLKPLKQVVQLLAARPKWSVDKAQLLDPGLGSLDPSTPPLGP